MEHARPRRTALRAAAAVGAAALAVAGLVATSGSANAADTNIVTNGGFESGLSGWSCTASSGAAVGSPVHGGTKALQGTPSSSDNSRCSQTISVRPNSTYTLSAFVQGSYVYLGATGTGMTEASVWTPSASSYQQLSTSFTTGASTTSVTVYLHGWYAQPAYLADDVSLLGAPGTGTPTPTPTPTDPTPT
ncbi:carbohydrate binding domain-containing protein, partial [Streptomyces sp. PA03-6a]|nr:carbohydrate binding domain-containing protein [Streptomyces sp. PA03-6a]